MSQATLKVLVAGGGIGGLTTALCLARRGHEVAVFEQGQTFDETGAGIQISPNASRVLHSLGLADRLRAVGFLPDAAEFRDWRTGRVIASSPLGEDAARRFGAPYYHVHRGDLLGVLVEAAEAEPHITLSSGRAVTDVQQSVGRATLILDGGEASGDVVVGADGIHSTVRQMLWNDSAPIFTGHIAWRALVPSERLPTGLVRPAATAWWGPRRHFVHYYVRGGALVNCVCVVEKTGWEVESWTERGDVAELRAELAGWSPDLQVVLDAIPSTSLFKWALFDRPPMQHWGRGRVTLLGDACHPTLPFMAQGAAMAIEDAAVLSGCLGAHPVEDALARYADIRRRRTASVQAGSRRNGRGFHLSGAAAWARNLVAGLAGDRTMARLYRYDALSAGRS